MTIHLVPALLPGSSNLPGNSGGQPSNASLFGLAPGGVYLAPTVTGRTGELLPHPFTLTRHSVSSPTHMHQDLLRRIWPKGRNPHMTSLRKLSAWRFPFCGTCLPVAATGRYPAPCPVEPGLSSPLPERQSSGHLSYSNIPNCLCQKLVLNL